MVLLNYCTACQMGDHKNHREVIQAVPPGMLGGARCRCEGECAKSNPIQSVKSGRFLSTGRERAVG